MEKDYKIYLNCVNLYCVMHVWQYEISPYLDEEYRFQSSLPREKVAEFNTFVEQFIFSIPSRKKELSEKKDFMNVIQGLGFLLGLSTGAPEYCRVLSLNEDRWLELARKNMITLLALHADGHSLAQVEELGAYYKVRGTP